MKIITIVTAVLLIAVAGGWLLAQQRHVSEPAGVEEREPPQPVRIDMRQYHVDVGGQTPPEFYQLIIDNNLFRPLGWTPPVKDTGALELIGTVITEQRRQAVLKEKTSDLVHFVNVGETLNDYTLVQVHPKHVVLEKEGQHLTRHLNPSLFLSPNRTPANWREHYESVGPDRPIWTR